MCGARAAATREGEPRAAAHRHADLDLPRRLARLSPHAGDMTPVIAAFSQYARGDLTPTDLKAALRVASPPGPLVDGYLRGAPGARAPK